MFDAVSVKPLGLKYKQIIWDGSNSYSGVMLTHLSDGGEAVTTCGIAVIFAHHL